MAGNHGSSRGQTPGSGVGLSGTMSRHCPVIECWLFVHAGGTTHFGGAAHKTSGPYAHSSRCAQCGAAVGPKQAVAQQGAAEGGPTKATAQHVAAHVMAYPCAPCNCCCARLTLKTTCRRCKWGGPRRFHWCNARVSFLASAPRDETGNAMFLHVPRGSGSPEGCLGYVCQPACAMRDYRLADSGPPSPRAGVSGGTGARSGKAPPAHRDGGGVLTPVTEVMLRP